MMNLDLKLLFISYPKKYICITDRQTNGPCKSYTRCILIWLIFKKKNSLRNHVSNKRQYNASYCITDLPTDKKTYNKCSQIKGICTKPNLSQCTDGHFVTSLLSVIAKREGCSVEILIFFNIMDCYKYSN